MNLDVAGRLPAVVLCQRSRLAMAKALGLAWCLSLFASALAEDGGYVPPRFISSANNRDAGQPLPRHPASPLAGGPAAAYGGQFMDVQGNPIVMPASYSPSCPSGGGGYCPSGPGGPGGYGDPMAVDFGGYGQDQCGPHYFDVSIDAVFLTAEDPFAVPLISVGAGGNLLDVTSNLVEFEAGWRIAGRYDLGPLSFIEGTYMGLYDIGFSDQIRSEDATVAVGQPSQQFQLFSVFSNFGVPLPIDGLDDGNVYTFSQDSDLQSTEITYRRYWMGFSPRVTGTLLCGFRYLRMTEDFTFNAVALGGSTDISLSSENDLVGFQLGGDGWLCLRQGLRIGTEAKAGIYNNRFKFRKAGDFAQGVGINAPNDFDVPFEGNQVAFAAESGVTLVADILSSWSFRGGYQVLYLNSLATIGGNANLDSTAVGTQGDALYHGFHGGIEYIW